MRSMYKYSDINFLITFAILNNAFVHAFELYSFKIPNGRRVPDPCNPSQVWLGVGHQNAEGGEINNLFGIHFAEEGYTWSREFCKMDSDKDGRTNGEELGDAHCRWRYNKDRPVVPEFTANITHPGVCENKNESVCVGKNLWLECKSTEFCNATKAPDVQMMTLSFPKTLIPEQPDSYFCRFFDFPSDRLYDIIANTPAIDNKIVAHHMILFGCETTPANMHNGSIFECSMPFTKECTQIIAIWSGASTARCFAEQNGIRIGSSPTESGMMYGVLQIHWRNLALQSDLYDSSGLNLYYVPQKRSNRLSVLMLAQTNFFLPPRLPAASTNASCVSSCTEDNLVSPVIMKFVFIHMHQHGIYYTLEHFRIGSQRIAILDKFRFDSNSPYLLQLVPEVELAPGDELKLTCFYSTVENEEVIYDNKNITGEMCIAFITYYTNETGNSLSHCGQFKHVPLCQHMVNRYNSICDYTSAYKAGVLIQKHCNRTCTAACMNALDIFEATDCTTDMAYDLGMTDDVYRSFYNQFDFCRLFRNPQCNMLMSIDLSSTIISTCDFNCTTDCVNKLKLLRRYGCLDIGWRYFETVSRRLVALSMSCDPLGSINSSTFTYFRNYLLILIFYFLLLIF